MELLMLLHERTLGITIMKTAYYDEVTGLPDFNLLENVLTDYMLNNSCKQYAGEDRFALVYLDINNFKYYNEIYGIYFCDKLIKSITDNLTIKVPNSNYVIRIKSDKFAILFTKIESDDQLRKDIEEIIDISGNLKVSENILYVTMSAGVAIYPEHGKDTETLLKRAETASYFAKKSGKDICIYNEGLHRHITSQLQMVNMLQTGMEREELCLFYQPEFCLGTNKIIGVEALIRWKHPVEGYISPDLFIPIAEKSKQIYPLERWIITKALQQKEQWEREGLNGIELSINLSGKTLDSESNFRKIEEIILSHPVDYSKITFEITETVIISQIDQAINRLKRLRSYGMKIALDDFGTGYSSLVNILNMPIDIIKIDKSFIKSIPNGNEEKVITKNLITLAHELNYRVVAEGIETQMQLEFLQKISCERGQGYYLCRPLPIEELGDLLVHRM
jgi:diguanylate cyclase (GGDEF)-like protein